MAKKKSLLPAQQAEIKRMYLQRNDKELAQLIGSDSKTVCDYRKQNGLIRNYFTESKLSKRDEKKETTTLDKKGGSKASKTVSADAKEGSS